MDSTTILHHVDHTLLNPCAAWKDIVQLCEEALRLKTASVCIPPSYVARVAQAYGEKLTICTVIGFPLGYHTPEAKLAEVTAALRDGAKEFDVVVNLGDVKNGEFDKITKELASLKKAIGSLTLKVIVETCYLEPEEKKQLCRCVTDSGADYIKTSTGFGTGGADAADIQLFKEHIGQGVKIKASGGIRTKEDFERFYALGCARIGASSAAKVY